MCPGLQGGREGEGRGRKGSQEEPGNTNTEVYGIMGDFDMVVFFRFGGRLYIN